MHQSISCACLRKHRNTTDCSSLGTRYIDGLLVTATTELPPIRLRLSCGPLRSERKLNQVPRDLSFLHLYYSFQSKLLCFLTMLGSKIRTSAMRAARLTDRRLLHSLHASLKILHNQGSGAKLPTTFTWNGLSHEEGSTQAMYALAWRACCIAKQLPQGRVS